MDCDYHPSTYLPFPRTNEGHIKWILWTWIWVVHFHHLRICIPGMKIRCQKGESGEEKDAGSFLSASASLWQSIHNLCESSLQVLNFPVWIGCRQLESSNPTSTARHTIGSKDWSCACRNMDRWVVKGPTFQSSISHLPSTCLCLPSLQCIRLVR